MKKRKFIQTLGTLIVTLLVMMPQLTIAQSENRSDKFDATVDANMLVVLDDSAPVKSVYTADISNMSFKDEASAKKAFNHVSSNLVSYEVNWDDQTVAIFVHNDRLKEDRSIQDWNKYFFNKTQR